MRWGGQIADRRCTTSHGGGSKRRQEGTWSEKKDANREYREAKEGGMPKNMNDMGGGSHNAGENSVRKLEQTTQIKVVLQKVKINEIATERGCEKQNA